MSHKISILLVEDEPNICNFITATLSAHDYRVSQAHTGKDALSIITSQCPDLVILDLGLPDMDGMEILSRLRKWSGMPVVVISARSHEKDKVEALDLGADDYITKPFGTSEMLARIRAAIRHSRAGYQGPAGGMTGVFEAKDLLIDYDKHRAYKGGLDLNLTQNEFRLVSLLSRYAGKVLTYDFMIREIWGPNMENNNRILRVNMANIRRKLEKNPAQPEYIFTEIGVGYRMIEPEG